MKRLQDKTALVTGGASGLGSAIVRRLLEEGARVTLTDVQDVAGKELAAKIGCPFIRQDVTEEKQWEQVIREVSGRFGSLHIVVNNAGIEGSFDLSNPETTLLSDWRAVHRVNVEGTFLGCRAAIPALRYSGGGAIINISSIAGVGGTPDFAAYGASKAAVLQFTKSVALYCARSGSNVRCNSIHPGIIQTPMLERIIEARARHQGVPTQQVREEFKRAIPQGEFQEPEDVAAATAFLASDEARHITGAAVVIDGGYTLGISS